MACRCDKPIQSADPRRPGACLRCSKAIGSGVVISDQQVKEFFDRLASTFPGRPPESFQAFRHHCERRELAGRPIFGLEYLRRDNLAESLEESTDAAIYMLLDTLKQRRAGVEDDDMGLVLTAAYHAFKCHETVRNLAAKRRASPQR